MTGSFVLQEIYHVAYLFEREKCTVVPAFRLTALLPIGMWQVSSVNFEDTVKVSAKVNKGDMLGYFLFGGSDHVILFQDKVDFQLTVPRASGGTYKHVLMGEEYSRLSLKK